MHYRNHRYHTSFTTTVETPFGPQKVEVRDVNTGGARLSGVANLTRGHKIRLDVLSARVTGVVQWARGEEAGLRFLPELTDAQVDVLRKRHDRRAPLRPGAVGFRFPEMR